MNNQNTAQIENIEEYRPHDETIVFLGTKELAKYLGCSIPTAREIMYRADFPTIRVGKNLKVLKTALEQWAMQKRM
ncbi:MAG: helix-turn-helix domain-containing protein [Ruminococcus sp.]|nr:helix-turn-helix domain-containing protein [Ruminococcus sp.]